MRSEKEENLGKRECGMKMRRKSKPLDSRNQRNRHQPRRLSRARVELWLVWFGVGGAEFDGLAVRGVAVGVGPGFFASQERRLIRQTFCREQVLKSGEPVVVIMGAIVGFAAVGCGFEFGGEGGGPFLPGEMAVLGEFHG